jgi:hypothetical protein
MAEAAQAVRPRRYGPGGAALAAQPDASEVWVFAWGSLIRNPDFHFVERRVARLACRVAPGLLPCLGPVVPLHPLAPRPDAGAGPRRLVPRRRRPAAAGRGRGEAAAPDGARGASDPALLPATLGARHDRRATGRGADLRDRSQRLGLCLRHRQGGAGRRAGRCRRALGDDGRRPDDHDPRIRAPRAERQLSPAHRTAGGRAAGRPPRTAGPEPPGNGKGAPAGAPSPSAAPPFSSCSTSGIPPGAACARRRRPLPT